MNLLTNLFRLNLPEMTLRIDNSPDFKMGSIAKGELSRTLNYQIALKIEGGIGESSHYGYRSGSPAGTVIKGSTMPSYRGETSASEYVFEHCHFESSHTNFPQNKVQVQLEPHKVRMTRKEQTNATKYTVIYFLNGIDFPEMNYHHRIRIYENSVVRAEFESRSLFEYADDSPSWVNVQRFEVFGLEAYFGATPKEYASETKTSFLILNGDCTLEANSILSVSRFLSFVFGTEFVSYGNAKLDAHLWPNSVEYVNISGSMYSDIEFDRSEPILPVGIQDERTRDNLWEAFSDILNNFLQLESVYNMNMVTWYIIQSNRLPLELRVQPLAAAFDSVMTIWFEQNQGSGKPKYMSDSEFESLTSELVQEFTTRLNGNQHKEVILNKFKSLNEMGYVQQAKQFLAGIGIEPSRDELEILRFRHKIVHGSAKLIDSEDGYRLSNGFRTLLVRSLLKLFGHKGSYLDYASLGFPVRGLDESIQVSKQGRPEAANIR